MFMLSFPNSNSVYRGSTFTLLYEKFCSDMYNGKISSLDLQVRHEITILGLMRKTLSNAQPLKEIRTYKVKRRNSEAFFPFAFN
jgi:hypothetical protein